MKLITAIAALALLAGSMDVEAQKRGKANNPPGGGTTPGTHQKAPEGAETGHPHISPVAHLAIGVFGALDPEERNDLAEAAGEGDEEALEELRAERVEAIEAMLGALEDPESRKLIEVGMLLGGADGFRYGITASPEMAQDAGGIVKTESHDQIAVGSPVEQLVDNEFPVVSLHNLDEKLDMVQEHLEAQLNQFGHLQEIH